jgi:hypothetical protein
MQDAARRGSAVAAGDFAKRLSDHLREANRKLMTFTQVSRAMQQELDAAHAINRRLLDSQGPDQPF